MKKIIIKNDEKCVNLAKNGIDKIISGLSDCDYAVELDISSLDIDLSTKYINEWFFRPKITSLTFSMTRFTSMRLHSIAKSIISFKDYGIIKKKFGLSGNDFIDVFGKTCFKEISDIVKDATFIEHIDLSSNSIDEYGFKQIIDCALQRNTLKSLDLSDNSFNFACLVYLLELLVSMEKEVDVPLINIKHNFGTVTSLELRDFVSEMLQYIVNDQVYFHLTFFTIMKEVLKIVNLSFFNILLGKLNKQYLINIINFKMDSYLDLCHLDDDKKDLVVCHNHFNIDQVSYKTKSIIINHAINEKELENNLFTSCQNTLKNVKKISLYYN